jgi:TRAP transporter TAXI family solute receptor
MSACLAALPASSGWAQKKHEPIQFISGGPNGTWFPVAAAAADLANTKYDGQPISVIPGGGISNPVRVGERKSDIGISYGSFLKLASQGNNSVYKKGYPELRAISAMASLYVHAVGVKDLGLNILSELKAKKPKITFATAVKGTAGAFVAEKILEEYGVTIQDIKDWGGKVLYVGGQGRTDGWRDRQIDLIITFLGVGDPKWVEAMNAVPGHILSLDSNIVQALGKKWGFLESITPANSYPGQAKDIKTVKMPYVYFATTRLDAEMAYNLTKGIAEGKDRLVKAFAGYKSWQPESMTNGLGIAMHEGATRYYKERGWIK